MSIFYIYALTDPNKPGNFKYNEYIFNFEPFYIGYGQDNRMFKHLYEYEMKKNPLKGNKIKKILKTFNKIIFKKYYIIKIKDNLTEYEAKNIETKMIKTIGRIDLGTGPLTNLTDGGEGTNGIICSDETKRKIRDAHIGKKFSDEHKQKISKAVSGKSNYNYGRPISLERKEKQSYAMSGEKNSNSKWIYKLSNEKDFWKDLTKNQRSSIMHKFLKKKSNIIEYKNILITRVLKK